MSSSRVLAKRCMNAFYWGHAEGSGTKQTTNHKTCAIGGRVAREKPHMWEERSKVQGCGQEDHSQHKHHGAKKWEE